MRTACRYEHMHARCTTGLWLQPLKHALLCARTSASLAVKIVATTLLPIHARNRVHQELQASAVRTAHALPRTTSLHHLPTMATLPLLGALILAYGPVSMIFIKYVMHHSISLIMCIFGAFFMAMGSLFAASIAAIPGLDSPAPAVLIGCVLVEAARLAVIHIYGKIEARLLADMPATSKPMLVDVNAAVAMGTGFGIMHAISAYGAVLAKASSIATLQVQSCSGLTLFHMSAIQALLVSLVHIPAMVLALHGVRRLQAAKVWWINAGVASARMAFALVSLAAVDSCIAVLVCQSAITLGMFVAAAMLIRSPAYGRFARGVGPA